MNFPKYVQSNTRSLDTAIREAANPMMEWYDEKHDDLPFFANVVTDIGYNEPGFKHDFGNYHHTSWSARTLREPLDGIPLSFDACGRKDGSPNV